VHHVSVAQVGARGRCCGVRTGCDVDRSGWRVRAAQRAVFSSCSGVSRRRGHRQSRRRTRSGNVRAPRVFAVPHGVDDVIRGNVDAGLSVGSATARRPTVFLVDLDPDRPRPDHPAHEPPVLGHEASPVGLRGARGPGLVILATSTPPAQDRKFRRWAIDPSLPHAISVTSRHDAVLAASASSGRSSSRTPPTGASRYLTATRLQGNVVHRQWIGGGRAPRVRLLSDHGAQVVVADIDDTRSRGRPSIGAAAIYPHLDVRSESDWRAVLDAAVGASTRSTALA